MEYISAVSDPFSIPPARNARDAEARGESPRSLSRISLDGEKSVTQRQRS